MARLALVGAAVALLSASSGAQITGILTPKDVNSVQALGSTQTYTLDYDVNVPSSATGKADVMFLTDTTGSMWGYIESMKTAFSDILMRVSASLPGVDIRYGVADYKDYFDGGAYQTTGVNLRQGFTADPAQAQSAIDSLTADGGWDWPEEQLRSMTTLAADWLSADYGGRVDAQKLLIWGGDSPGHSVGEAEVGGLSDWYPTLEDAIASLNSQGIKVFGLNVFGDDLGIDDALYGQQEDAITAATGGMSFYSVGNGGATVGDAVTKAITSGIMALTNITLSLTSDDGDFSVTPWTCTRTGSWSDGTVTGSFSFEATAPVEPGFASFDYVLLGNGAELDRSHIYLTTEADPVPGALPQSELDAGLARPQRQSGTRTED
jgi:hypothetical protein